MSCPFLKSAARKNVKSKIANLNLEMADIQGRRQRAETYIVSYKFFFFICIDRFNI